VTEEAGEIQDGRRAFVVYDDVPKGEETDDECFWIRCQDTKRGGHCSDEHNPANKSAQRFRSM
jgi:hypothetical protein